jgi:hypothetical protein
MSGGPPWYHPLTLEQAAQHAQNLMDDPLLVQAINEIRRDAIETWQLSKQPSQREEQWHTVDALRRLNDMLQARLDDVRVRERAQRRVSQPRD